VVLAVFELSFEWVSGLTAGLEAVDSDEECGILWGVVLHLFIFRIVLLNVV